MEQLKAFIEKAHSDKELMAKLDTLGEKDAGVDEIIALAKEYGFLFTVDEIEKFRSESAPCSAELNEEDLEAVAGGLTKNRWNPSQCRKYNRTYWDCVGPVGLIWCDHYRISFAGTIRDPDDNLPVPVWKHKCVMGIYDYHGYLDGDPVKV